MARNGRKITTDGKNIFAKRSYRDIIYGAVTVLVLFAAGILGLNRMDRAGTLGEPGITTERSIEEKTYTVREGDTLWDISQKVYDDAYRWPILAEANRILSPEIIAEGTKLIIPDLPRELTLQVITATPTQKPISDIKPTVGITEVPDVEQSSTGSSGSESNTSYIAAEMTKIVGGSYTVVRGDNLWNIAVRAYGDGFKWVEIAKANKLANPNLIHSGNVFTLPR